MGGAAVEYYTASALMTVDIDLAEVVASTPMDGTVDYRRLVLVHGLAEGSAVATIRSRT